MSHADPLRLADYFRHILDAIDNIQTYTTGLYLAAFRVDRKTQDAVIRNLEVIGEACHNIAKNHSVLRHRMPRCPGALPKKCATHCHTATSRWTLPSCGKPFKTTCPACGLK